MMRLRGVRNTLLEEKSTKNMEKKVLNIHADDYALSPNSDKDILNLCKLGKLDSISIIPNLDIFQNSVSQFITEKQNFPKEINVSVHLNVMEGKCCADKDSLPDLVNEQGLFTVSWGKLFIWNYIPWKKNIIKLQLKKEISAQIKKCIEANIITADKIRIDSHQHPHMIPLFFDSIIEVLEEEKFQAEYIRNTQDPLSFYFMSGGFKDISISNVIKCILLNHFSKHARKILKKRQLPVSYLCGVFFSGKMDARIEKYIQAFIKNSKKNNYITELLFHPGLMLSEEINYEFTKAGFNDFHLSENRAIEYKEVLKYE